MQSEFLKRNGQAIIAKLQKEISLYEQAESIAFKSGCPDVMSAYIKFLVIHENYSLTEVKRYFKEYVQ